MIHMIDAILALVIFEAMALTIYYQKTGRGIAPARLIPNLAAGFFLLLAVRLSLGGPVWALPVSLLAAFAAHGADLVQRWRQDAIGGHLSDV